MPASWRSPRQRAHRPAKPRARSVHSEVRPGALTNDLSAARFATYPLQKHRSFATTRQLGGLTVLKSGRAAPAGSRSVERQDAWALEDAHVPEGFSALLRKYRLLAGMTQEELATRAGLSPRTISDLERGIHAAPFRHTVTVLSRSLQLNSEQMAALEGSIVRIRGGRRAGPGQDTVLGDQVPVPLTPIVGREREIDLCINLLVRDRVRLLTLTGIGGVGKTRLALEVARHLTEAGRTVTLVRLDELEAEMDMLPAIGRSLGLNVDEISALRDLIAVRLLGEKAVLLLENFEHVIGARLELLDLLERSPTLQVLVTSHGPLRIHGEHTLLLEPLDVLGPGEHAFEEIESCSGVRLFDTVARMRAPGFALTRENAEAVLEIVISLDGLPLAIELAASQAPVLSPTEILEDLRGSPGLLGRSPPDFPARQPSIHESILWSYALLTARQQRLLRFCSVFPGAWTADHLMSLEASSGAERLLATLDLLGPLVSCGLVQRVPGSKGESRFRLLRLVKDYMHDLLRINSEWEAAHERFTAMMTYIVRRETLALQPLSATSHGHSLDGEEENLRTALDWLLATGRITEGLQLLWAARFWLIHRARPGLEAWLRTANDKAALADAETRPYILPLLAAKLIGRGDFARGDQVLRQATVELRAQRRGDDLATLVELVSWAPMLPPDLGELADRQVEEFRRSGEIERLGQALAARAARCNRTGDYATAESCCLEAIVLDRWLLPHVDPRMMLALTYLIAGRCLDARALLEGSLQSLQSDDQYNGPFMLALLGVISQTLSDDERAREEYRRSFLAATRKGSTHPLGLCLEGAAWLASREGAWADAACMLGAASRAELPRSTRTRLHLTSGLTASIREHLAKSDYEAAYRAGVSLPLERALALASKYIESHAPAGGMT